MEGMVLVQDTKKPNKDPFEVSSKAFEGLQKAHPNRYVSMKTVIVTPDKIEVKVTNRKS